MNPFLRYRILPALFALALPGRGEESRPAQSWQELAAVISPRADEIAWLQIPWETDLVAARRKAVAQNRPLFLWQMDGHPLGCT